jgi:HEAT repeat protein
VSGDEMNSWRRLAMALQLTESDDPASEEVLWGLLDDPDEQVRDSAASSLIHRNPQLDAAELLQRLRRSSDGSPPTADEILRYGLSGLKSVDVVSPLIEALDSAGRPDRPDLLFALAKTQQPAALEPLRARLNSEDADTRRKTAWLFGLLWPLGDGALQPLLAVVRTSSDAKQRANACDSLSNWFSTSDEAVETVLEAALADSSWRVRREAGETLAVRRAVTRPRVEAARRKGGTLRVRLRARLILRRMNLLDAQGWRGAIFKTTRVLRALPFVAGFVAMILRDMLRYRFSTRRDG